ncbi:MAG: hypothetical protein JO101_00140 [Candidatus Eremiobacteraeota bacterium]|nr:hypothetical protein [Candidatus Eremiobacteraeota bacterium]MBV8353701.1 hypothetical protein [Candidatus Eremiobacteraeota bacterium]
MRRFLALVCAAAILVGCREVRVKTYAEGATAVVGPPQILVIRDRRDLEELGIRKPVRFQKEFGVVLLMGPHRQTGYYQVIESIRANADRVRIVAFEKEPLDPEPTREYRTYTLWIVPNSVYRVGSHVDVVTPSGDPIASTTLK